MTNEAFSLVGWGGDSQVLISETSGQQAPSAETYFLVKMEQVPGLMTSLANKYQQGTMSTLYTKCDLQLTC